MWGITGNRKVGAINAISGQASAFQQDFDTYRSLLLCGEDTIEPRVTRVPVRLPLPPAAHQGSIYENQRARASRYFQTAEEREPRGRLLTRPSRA